MNAVCRFLAKVRRAGRCRGETVRTVAMGREREFSAYDFGGDTFILENGVTEHLDERPSVLIVRKSALGRKTRGRVMTVTTGNHSVAAFPLLDGRFWRLSSLPASRRSAVLMTEIISANAVDGMIELSRRDVSLDELVSADAWLMEVVGLPMDRVVVGARDPDVLEHYRLLGQEWRVRPLAWTESEIRTAIAASRKRISSTLTYYHSSRGVHFLSFAEFRRFCTLAETDPEEFVKGLRELVGVFEGNDASFVRMPKHRGHHEIEFFGLRRGVALERLIPELEALLDAVSHGRVGQLGVIQRAQEAASLYESLLARQELSDESSRPFMEGLYMHLTGEVYAVVGEGSMPAFDDRRTALPGATFVAGRPVLHPGADSRTRMLLGRLCEIMSKGEVIEHANIYELRAADGKAASLGKGATREVVYKTNLRPLTTSLVEKRLSRSGEGYGEYVLARIGALRGLGVSLSDFYLMLKRRKSAGKRPSDYYIRRRCAGDPMEAIPASSFRSRDGAEAEDSEVVLALATLMGDAAAQNMAMKKYDPGTESPLYGVGKEIYEFGHDAVRGRMMPRRVCTCSVRGSMGWPCLDYTDENMRALSSFYLQHYAHALKAFQKRHPAPMKELATRFMDGFAHRTRSMEWRLSVMRDRFDAFDPKLPGRYTFVKKWKFVMWSLERQMKKLPALRKMFFEKVRVIEHESLRNNPQ